MSPSTVIVTRPEGDDFSRVLRECGVDLVELPLFIVKSLAPSEESRVLLSSLDRFDWLIFTSQHGVRFGHQLISAPIPHALKIAVIGEKTSQAFESNFGRTADFVGAGDSSEHFASSFLAARFQTEKLLLMTAREHRGVISRCALERGVSLTELPVYEQSAVAVSPDLLQLIGSKSAKDLIWPFFSPSAVRHCAALGPEIRSFLKIGKVLAIGPVTAAALIELGVEGVVEPDVHTEEGMMQLISEMVKR